ncbi:MULTISPECIES: hypothetical protein [unclassified Moorena]|nr:MULTISPECIES: hypothetical protein [unclassified Moorena]
MRYTELFDYWLLPLLSYLLPAPCSLLPISTVNFTFVRLITFQIL